MVLIRTNVLIIILNSNFHGFFPHSFESKFCISLKNYPQWSEELPARLVVVRPGNKSQELLFIVCVSVRRDSAENVVWCEKSVDVHVFFRRGVGPGSWHAAVAAVVVVTRIFGAQVSPEVEQNVGSLGLQMQIHVGFK